MSSMMLLLCQKCGNFMNWLRLWGDIYRCRQCGHKVEVQARR